MSALFALVLSLLAVFLILLVLVQRGRGGGLAGALGGMGGSSAFGAKAGDIFTRITIVTATIWIVVSVVAVFWAGHRGDALSGTDSTTIDSPLDTAPLGGAGTTDTATPAGEPGANVAVPPAENVSQPTATAPASDTSAAARRAADAPASSAPAEGAPANNE